MLSNQYLSPELCNNSAASILLTNSIARQAACRTAKKRGFQLKAHRGPIAILLAHAFMLTSCLQFTLPPALLASPAGVNKQQNAEAMHAAEVLGVKSQVERYLTLLRGSAQESYQNEQLALKTLILRRTLTGFVQVRQASNKTDIELTYAYDVLRRQQEKQKSFFEALNLFNFTQLGILYTIAPYSRINKQFIQSSVLGLIQAGVGMGVPVLSILYGRYYSFKKEAPPELLKNSLGGAPVDGSKLPPLINKFMDSPAPGKTQARRQEMFDFWKINFGVNPADPSTLTSLNDNKRGTIGMLNKRIVLLWALRTQVQAFDQELMALSNLVKTPPGQSAQSRTGNLSDARLNRQAEEAARLLKIASEAAELIELNKNFSSGKRKQELDALVLERALNGTIEVRIATDKVDQELHYCYDIALADLTARRAAGLQKNFEANFIQNGVLISIAKYLFLKNYGKAANELIVISGGLSVGLSALALIQGRGGRRLMPSEPNSLAEFLGLDLSRFSFSPLMTDFLNQPNMEANDGKSRKDFLLDLWKREHISQLNLNSEKNQSKLAGMPPAKYDSIKILLSRIALLSSLKANLEFFDEDLHELVKATSPFKAPNSQAGQRSPGGQSETSQTAQLLGVTSTRSRGLSAQERSDLTQLGTELDLTRQALAAILDLRVTVDKLDLEIVRESEMRDRMARSRDRGIAVTNNANFFQLGILGCIDSGPLALSGRKRLNYNGDVGNIVSAYLVSGFTAAAFLQRWGGYRPARARANMLSQVLGLQASEDLQFSPLLWKYLNSTPAGSSQTRREQLIAYWKSKKLLPNAPWIKKRNAEILAANGPGHHWWSENIGLIDKRLRMLYLLRSTVDLLDVEISDLLQTLD